MSKAWSSLAGLTWTIRCERLQAADFLSVKMQHVCAVIALALLESKIRFNELICSLCDKFPCEVYFECTRADYGSLAF